MRAGLPIDNRGTFLRNSWLSTKWRFLKRHFMACKQILYLMNHFLSLHHVVGTFSPLMPFPKSASECFCPLAKEKAAFKDIVNNTLSSPNSLQVVPRLLFSFYHHFHVQVWINTNSFYVFHMYSLIKKKSEKHTVTRFKLHNRSFKRKKRWKAIMAKLQNSISFMLVKVVNIFFPI